MTYTVRFSCGHTCEIGLVGPYKERARKIAFFEESGLCPECFAKKQVEEMLKTHSIVEMKYSEYKNKFPECKSVPNSYVKATKTIKVYVKKEVPKEKIISKSEIFKAAHALTKKTLEGTVGLNYQVAFAACLREIYKEVSEAKEAIAA